MDNKYMGMKVLSLCILHLISIGEKETIATVEKEIEKGSLVTYLYNKGGWRPPWRCRPAGRCRPSPDRPCSE